MKMVRLEGMRRDMDVLKEKKKGTYRIFNLTTTSPRTIWEF